MSDSRSVLVLGATGLVGRECVRLLLADPAFARVVVLGRRPLEPEVHAAKMETRIVDFERLEDAGALFAVDAIICALGTTMKRAGTQDRFRRVDHDYPVMAARLGLANGAKHFLVVSALGADPHSRIFYNRVKGEMEEAILALGYESTTIVRPSLLLGPRHELRPMESLGKGLRFLPLRRYKPVPARAVAAALVRAAREGKPGKRILESEEIRRGGARG